LQFGFSDQTKELEVSIPSMMASAFLFVCHPPAPNAFRSMQVYRVSYRSRAKHKGYEYFDKAIVANAAVTGTKARRVEVDIHATKFQRTRKES